MAVSANTLFHFTGFDTIKKILTSGGFWPQYSLEHFENTLPSESKYVRTYIPMVCFCDLKLTQLSDINISKHTEDFGNYGIGFKKSWGIRNKISPVVYVHENSTSSIVIEKVIKKINESSITNNSEITLSLSEIVKFLKPYQGYWQKKVEKGSLLIITMKESGDIYRQERDLMLCPQLGLKIAK
jgi:hypothetical protein